MSPIVKVRTNARSLNVMVSMEDKNKTLISDWLKTGYQPQKIDTKHVPFVMSHQIILGMN
jgi:hypothetical protein